MCKEETPQPQYTTWDHKNSKNVRKLKVCNDCLLKEELQKKEMRQQNAANVQVSTDGISASQPVTSPPVTTSLTREVTFFAPSAARRRKFYWIYFGRGVMVKVVAFCDGSVSVIRARKRKPHWAIGCEFKTIRTAALLHG